MLASGVTFEVDPSDPEYIVIKQISQVDFKGNIPHWFMNKLGGGYMDVLKRYHNEIGDCKK